MKRRQAHRGTLAAAVAAPIAIRSTMAARAWAAVLVVAGLLAYANSLSNPFLLDDQRSIVENPQIRELWPLSTPLSPPPETPVARRPIVNLSFAITYAIGGLDVEVHRAGNLFVHLLAALVLFGLVRRVLSLEGMADRFGAHATTLAGVSSLIWLLHPLTSEVVDYVSQRTSSLMAVCYLLTLYCSVRALGSPHSRWSAAAVAACAAGMACKESMVSAPVVVMLFDRTFAFGSWAAAVRQRRPLYLGLAATWLILAVLMTDGSRTTVGFRAGVDAWTYLMNQASIVVDYLRLAVWPRELVVDYGPPASLRLADIVWRGTALACLAGAALVLLRRRPRAGFLAVSFFILLAPTSSVVPIATEVGAERRMYLPLAALVVLVITAIYRAGRIALERPGLQADASVRWSSVARGTACAAVVLVCSLLATGTYIRNHEYRSSVSIAEVTVARRPHGRARFALAHALIEDGRQDEAIGILRRSAVDFPPALFALGSELIAAGEIDAGVRELHTFATRAPDHPAVGSARQTIAAAWLDRGEYDLAIEELEAVLRLDPRAARAHMLLGEALLHQRQIDRAIDHLQRAAALQPRHARTLDLLGNALALDGRYQEARVQFTLAVQANPGYGPARVNLERLEQLLQRRGN